MSRAHAVLVAGILGAACVGAREPAPIDVVDESGRRRAALARIVIDNRTAHELRIGFHLATGPAGTVEVGRVPAYATAAVAPVAAGEPIVLFATTGAGARLRLPPRSFAADSTWTWIIAPDVRFTPPESR